METLGKYEYKEGTFLTLDNSVIQIKPKDYKKDLRNDCPYCMKNYKFAVKNKKILIVNLHTNDILGVVI